MRENFRPTILRVFGGLVSFIDRVALGLGVSPNVRNARFAPGMVASRAGYGMVTTDGGEHITGVSQLKRANGDCHLITISDGGRVKAEFPQGTLSYLIDGFVRSARMVSASIFSTQYMCFGDGRYGIGPLCRYDGVKFRMVGAGAPGSAPTLAESGTASAGTGLLAGKHSCAVVFVNEFGDYSGWSPVTSAVFAGGKKTSITVPLGPVGTVQRIIGITPADDARSFMYTEKTIINENTTATAITIDISEEEILKSELSISRWLTSFIPWNPLGCVAFQERLLLWGSRATLQPSVVFDPIVDPLVLQNVGFRNLSFDGGFAGNIPNGWSSSGSGHAVGGGASTEPFYSRCFRITGDNSTLTRGAISQTVRNNSLYLRPSARYGVAIMMKSPIATPGVIRVDLTGVTSGNLIERFEFPCGTDADGNWLQATLEMASVVANDEKSIKLDVSWVGAVVMGSSNYVDLKLALYDADDHQNLHSIYASDSGKAGTFVGETCTISVGPDDGEGIRSVFRLRDFLYGAKERSLYAITSATDGEPSIWSASSIDPLGGTPSTDGVACDDRVAFVANRDGAFLFDGASATCLSDDIEQLWRSAYWLNGHRAIVAHDRAKKIVRFALPMAADTHGASLLLTLDYKEGLGSAVPDGSGRKWAIDSFLTPAITGADAPGTNTEIMAACRMQMATGIHATILSLYGGEAFNHVSATDLSTPTWSFAGGSVVVTAGVADGRAGNNGTRWAFTGGVTHTASMTIPNDAGIIDTYPVVSFRVKPSVSTSLLVAVASGPSYARTVTANVWQRVVVPMIGFSSMSAYGKALSISFPSDGTYDMASFQIDTNSSAGDWGFTGSAGAGNGAISAVIVAADDSLHRDAGGAISFLYETAPFGEELGRSTFDSCIVRARGEGYLKAGYVGTGTRTWQMTQTQLVPVPDEDFEFGADLKAPGATLVLSLDDDDGWVVINRIGVANKAESIGWQRGRN